MNSLTADSVVCVFRFESSFLRDFEIEEGQRILASWFPDGQFFGADHFKATVLKGNEDKRENVAVQAIQETLHNAACDDAWLWGHGSQGKVTFFAGSNHVRVPLSRIFEITREGNPINYYALSCSCDNPNNLPNVLNCPTGGNFPLIIYINGIETAGFFTSNDRDIGYALGGKIGTLGNLAEQADRDSGVDVGDREQINLHHISQWFLAHYSQQNVQGEFKYWTDGVWTTQVITNDAATFANFIERKGLLRNNLKKLLKKNF